MRTWKGSLLCCRYTNWWEPKGLWGVEHFQKRIGSNLIKIPRPPSKVQSVSRVIFSLPNGSRCSRSLCALQNQIAKFLCVYSLRQTADNETRFNRVTAIVLIERTTHWHSWRTSNKLLLRSNECTHVADAHIHFLAFYRNLHEFKSIECFACSMDKLNNKVLQK